MCNGNLDYRRQLSFAVSLQRMLFTVDTELATKLASVLMNRD